MSDLLLKDETGDNEIRVIADQQECIVITKNADFYYSYILRQSPKRLLLISTGNIKNRQLLDLFRKNFQQIVEMGNIELIAHE